jgi:hypothetical protein
MAWFDEFREANERYAASFDRGDLPTPPARGVAVVTCMDARLHPERVPRARGRRRVRDPERRRAGLRGRYSLPRNLRAVTRDKGNCGHPSHREVLAACLFLGSATLCEATRGCDGPWPLGSAKT